MCAAVIFYQQILDNLLNVCYIKELSSDDLKP